MANLIQIQMWLDSGSQSFLAFRSSNGLNPLFSPYWLGVFAWKDKFGVLGFAIYTACHTTTFQHVNNLDNPLTAYTS